jgi:TolA-binding protein/DNA-binding beta-propeller fold protein YncE
VCLISFGATPAIDSLMNASLANASPVDDPTADSSPLDTRIYKQALDTIRAGKRREGAQLLRRLFTEFPSSRHAPAALLRLAEMIYPVSKWDEIGTATAKRIDEAAKLFERITRKHKSSPQVARALVKLGYLSLEPANPEFDLEAACGYFSTSARLHPESEAADAARFSSGMCESLRGQPALAARAFEHLLDEHPDSPLVPEALYRFGVVLSRLDAPEEAMLALQEVRSRHPGSPQAKKALGRLTLLHRMRILPALAKAEAIRSGERPTTPLLYRYDESYGFGGSGSDTAPGIRGSSDIAIDPQGRAIVASRKSPGVFRLGPQGAVQDRIDHPGPEFIAVGEGRAVYISGRNQIAVNSRNWSGPELRGREGRLVRKFGPIALDPTGRVYLLDPSDNSVLVFDRRRRLVGSVRPPGGQKGRFVDVAAGEDGGVYVLDGRARTVLELHQGRVTGSVSLTRLGTDEPVALAVDALGDLFVLDGRTGWIFVADPQGNRIGLVRPAKQVTSRLGDPAALAVDPTGRIYLCGRKSGRVVRFQ